MASLQADALDFFGDAANYVISPTFATRARELSKWLIFRG